MVAWIAALLGAPIPPPPLWSHFCTASAPTHLGEVSRVDARRSTQVPNGHKALFSQSSATLFSPPPTLQEKFNALFREDSQKHMKLVIFPLFALKNLPKEFWGIILDFPIPYFNSTSSPSILSVLDFPSTLHIIMNMRVPHLRLPLSRGFMLELPSYLLK